VKSCRKVKKFLAAKAFADILFCIFAVCTIPSGSRGKKVMLSSVAGELDFIDELRLRRWAGNTMFPAASVKWPGTPSFFDEMDRKDLERNEAEVVATCA